MSGVRSYETISGVVPYSDAGRMPAAPIVCALIVAFYCVLGLIVLAPEAVYSGDIGVKYVQARALAAHGFSSLDIPYPGGFLDPRREFFPMRPPFVMTAAGETQAIFPPAVAALQALPAALAGIQGLVAISVLAGAIILYSGWRLVPVELGTPLLLTLGLASPLWFYAVSGWEHAPAMAFATAAFAVAIRGRSRPAPLAAGLLIGAGATLRDEVILLAPGLLLCVWLRSRSGRDSGIATPAWLSTIVTAAAGIVVPLALAVAIDVFWFGRPAAAHLRHAVHIVQVAAGVSDAPNPDVPALQPFTLQDRYQAVVNYWLAGSGANRTIAGFLLAFGAALCLRWSLGSSIGFFFIAAALGAIAVGDVREVVTAPKWLAGLFRVAPWVALAFFPAPRGGSRYGWVPAAFASTAAFYLAVAFAGADTDGGKSLGPRLLMPMLPLLAVAAVMRIAEYLRGGFVNRSVATAGAVLILLTAAFHALGTIPAYLGRNREDASAVLAAAASPERIIVTDDPFTAQLLFPLYYRKIILLADSPEAGLRLGGLLQNQHLSGAVVVSRHPQPALTLTPLRLERSEPVGRMIIQYWRR